MLPPPPRPAARRAPRTTFTENTPTVLRSHNGSRVRGKLLVISLTGGLLWVSKQLDLGSRVKLIFLTAKGSVLGAAEMLRPISWTLQPFKFIKLYQDDEIRLQGAIQSSLSQNRYSHIQLERFRAW